MGFDGATRPVPRRGRSGSAGASGSDDAGEYRTVRRVRVLPPAGHGGDGMDHIDIDEAERGGPTGSDVGMRPLGDPLGTDDVAVNFYRLEPGEGFSGGMHAHLDQEEVFVVVEGEATFETTDDEVTVGPREAIRFAPGEYQTGRNEGDTEVVALALGAPKESTEIRVPTACRECGNDTLAAEPSEDGIRFVCPECGAEADLSA